MAFDTKYKHAGGLTYSSIGQKGTHTRIISMGSPELLKLREELRNSSLIEKKNLTLRELLDRLDEQPEQLIA